MEFKHKSVLLDETIDSLNIKPDGIYVDGTLGGGGHSLEICKRLSEKGRLIGIDQDLGCDCSCDRAVEGLQRSCNDRAFQLSGYRCSIKELFCERC